MEKWTFKSGFFLVPDFLSIFRVDPRMEHPRDSIFQPGTRTPTNYSTLTPEQLRNYVAAVPRATALIGENLDITQCPWRNMPISNTRTSISLHLTDDSINFKRSNEAIIEMCNALSLQLLICVSNYTLFFAEPHFVPILWAVLVLLVDNGSECRLSLSHITLHTNATTLAKMIFNRIWAILCRALAVEPDWNALDAAVPVSFCDFNTGKGPLSRFALRPCVVYVLSSVLLSCGSVWKQVDPDCLPFRVQSAMNVLSSQARKILFGSNEMEIGNHIDSTCRIVNRTSKSAFVIPEHIMMALIVGSNVRDIRNHVACGTGIRMLIYADQLYRDAFYALLRVASGPERKDMMAAFSRLTYQYDNLRALYTTATSYYPVTVDMYTKLPLYINSLRKRVGKSIPLPLLLTCAPGDPFASDPSSTIPEINLYAIKKSTAPIYAHYQEAQVIAIADMYSTAETASQALSSKYGAIVHASSLVRGCPSWVRYHFVGGADNNRDEADAEQFANYIAAVRLIGAIVGDRTWNAPCNFYVASNQIHIEATSARVFMLRDVMLRVYCDKDAPVRQFPYVSPILTRELITLGSITNLAIQGEVAAALCDLIFASIRLEPPSSLMVQQTSRQSYIVINSHGTCPWATSVCLNFIHPMFGKLIPNYFGDMLFNQEPIHMGILSTIEFMVQSPVASDLPVITWPLDVLNAILRYFFVLYMYNHQGCGAPKKDDDDTTGELPCIIEDNMALVQALAFLYIRSVLTSELYQHIEKLMNPPKRNARVQKEIDPIPVTYESVILGMYPCKAPRLESNLNASTPNLAQKKLYRLDNMPSKNGSTKKLKKPFFSCAMYVAKGNNVYADLNGAMKAFLGKYHGKKRENESSSSSNDSNDSNDSNYNDDGDDGDDGEDADDVNDDDNSGSVDDSDSVAPQKNRTQMAEIQKRRKNTRRHHRLISGQLCRFVFMTIIQLAGRGSTWMADSFVQTVIGSARLHHVKRSAAKPFYHELNFIAATVDATRTAHHELPIDGIYSTTEAKLRNNDHITMLANIAISMVRLELSPFISSARIVDDAVRVAGWSLQQKRLLDSCSHDLRIPTNNRTRDERKPIETTYAYSFRDGIKSGYENAVWMWRALDNPDIAPTQSPQSGTACLHEFYDTLSAM